jgi:hypothetical protein
VTTENLADREKFATFSVRRIPGSFETIEHDLARMSARVSVDIDELGQIRIALRQSGSEVLLFGLFVVGVVIAVYALMAQARTSAQWLFVLLGLGATWSVIAMTAREDYAIDGRLGVVDATRSSVLGRARRELSTGEVAAVRLAITGPDDNRRLIELVNSDGGAQLSIPWRLTTLSPTDQWEVGQLIAHGLGVPLIEHET